jgi:hypothetical protein
MIDPSSIRISVADSGTKPIFTIFKTPTPDKLFPNFVRFELVTQNPHLGRLFAVVATARARFLMGPGDTLKGWHVGFFQVMRLNVERATYAGRTPFEGTVVCDPFLKFQKPVVLLDHADSTIMKPWYEHPDDESDFKGPVATPSMGDGPGVDVPLTMQNHTASNVDNFLFRFEKNTEYFTVLTATPPGWTPGAGNPPELLAHFRWTVVHLADFRWSGGIPLPHTSLSKYSRDKDFTLGPPIDGAIKGTLSNPTGQFALDVTPPAFRNSLLNDPETHREFPEHLFLIPRDFWS